MLRLKDQLWPTLSVRTITGLSPSRASFQRVLSSGAIENLTRTFLPARRL